MPFCPTERCPTCWCCLEIACRRGCHEIRWVCFQCGTVDPDHERDDGLPPGWEQNTDGDPFCAACLERSPLDPPEED